MATLTIEAAYDGQTSTTTKTDSATTFQVSGATAALRAFARFTISSIPTGSVITNTRMQLQVTVEDLESTDSVQFRPYNADGTTDPSADAASTCHTRCGSGSVLAAFTTEFQSVGLKEVDLGASADALIQGIVDAAGSIVSFGLTSLNFAATESVTLASRSHGTNPGPTLIVDYTPPPTLVALVGSQPLSSGLLARLIYSFRALGGSQPASSGIVSGALLTANLDVTLKQGATTIATWPNQFITGTITDYELPITEAELDLIVSPANNLTVEINADLEGGAKARVYAVTLVVPAKEDVTTAPQLGSQPNSTGILTFKQPAKQLFGAQPSSSGTLTCILLLLRSLTGSQPASSGLVTRRQTLLRVLSGSQPFSSGLVVARQLLLKALAGTQPNSSGLLTISYPFTRRTPSGTQPYPTGTLEVSTSGTVNLGGTQPASSGILEVEFAQVPLVGAQPSSSGLLRFIASISKAGSQPSSSGTLTRLQSLMRSLTGTQPNATGSLRTLASIKLTGSQPNSSGSYRILASRKFAGSQPASSGVLGKFVLRLLAGSQPFSTGNLVIRVPKSLDGSQPNSTGSLRTVSSIKLNGSQPASSGIVTRIRYKLLTGSQPFSTGIVTRLRFRSTTGLQPASTGTLRIVASIKLYGFQPAARGTLGAANPAALFPGNVHSIPTAPIVGIVSPATTLPTAHSVPATPPVGTARRTL